MKIVRHLVPLLSIFIFCNCNPDDSPTNPSPVNDDFYILLPEAIFAYNSNANLFAFYTDPTERYPHGAIGDQIEAGGIVVQKDGKDYYHQLEEAFVFEDLRPRLYDVDQDGELEIITIRTSLTQGASVAVYKIIDEELTLIASTNFIGTANRWLNISAIEDLNNDGLVEIALVQTPHIGGILRIFTFENNELNFISDLSGVSNHKLNSRNLCLSLIAENQNQKTLYIPSNSFNEVIGFELLNNEIVEVDRIVQTVDTDQPLYEQFPIDDISDLSNCIVVK